VRQPRSADGQTMKGGTLSGTFVGKGPGGTVAASVFTSLSAIRMAAFSLFNSGITPVAPDKIPGAARSGAVASERAAGAFSMISRAPSAGVSIMGIYGIY